MGSLLNATHPPRVKRPVRDPGGIDSRTSFLGNPTTGERGPHRVGTGELGIDPGVDLLILAIELSTESSLASVLRAKLWKILLVIAVD